MRKQGSLVMQVIKEDPIGKRLQGRLRLWWKNCVKVDIKTIGPNIRGREAAEGWMARCVFSGMILKTKTKRRRRKHDRLIFCNRVRGNDTRVDRSGWNGRVKKWKKN